MEFLQGLDELVTSILQYEDESLQPAGVKVYEQASELGIPVVMITTPFEAGYHFPALAHRYLQETEHDIGEIYREDMDVNPNGADMFVAYKNPLHDPHSENVSQTWGYVFDRLMEKRN